MIFAGRTEPRRHGAVDRFALRPRSETGKSSFLVPRASMDARLWQPMTTLSMASARECGSDRTRGECEGERMSHAASPDTKNWPAQGGRWGSRPATAMASLFVPMLPAFARVHGRHVSLEAFCGDIPDIIAAARLGCQRTSSPRWPGGPRPWRRPNNHKCTPTGDICLSSSQP